MIESNPDLTPATGTGTGTPDPGGSAKKQKKGHTITHLEGDLLAGLVDLDQVTRI
jgi:hypothetical protein